MRRIACLLALLLLALTSCSATLRLSATTPALDNGGTCENPVFGPTAAGPNIFMKFVWYGAEIDSVTLGPYGPGVFVPLVRTVKPGIYTRYDGIAIDGGGESCRAILSTRDTLKSRLAAPTIRSEN